MNLRRPIGLQQVLFQHRLGFLQQNAAPAFEPGAAIPFRISGNLQFVEFLVLPGPGPENEGNCSAPTRRQTISLQENKNSAISYASKESKMVDFCGLCELCG